MRTPLSPFKAWRHSAFSFLLSTDFERLWTHRRVFDTKTLISRSLALFTSSNYIEKNLDKKNILFWWVHFEVKKKNTQIFWLKYVLKNEMLTLVRLIMSDSDTPSATLVPARITSWWSKYKTKNHIKHKLMLWTLTTHHLSTIFSGI